MQKILLAKERGFCAGVRRAIDLVEKAVRDIPKPIYVYHPIVHNERVIKDLQQKGVKFVENWTNLKKGAVLIFSAHGVSPNIRAQAKRKKIGVIDATCPLVNKVHAEAKKYHHEGYTIFLIGQKNHQEVVGTMGEAPMQLISSLAEVDKLKGDRNLKAVSLTQTTLSLDEAKEIIHALKQKFPRLIPSQNICQATTVRQNAVKRLAKKTDLIMVIGSKQSSNSQNLVKVAKTEGKSAFLITEFGELPFEKFKKIKILGLTAGASVPEILVKEVISKIKKKFPGVKVVEKSFQ